MNIKRILILAICTMFLFSLVMPNMAFAKGENDFTASLSVSDTSVSTGTTVTCTISVRNTDPTYGCDVSVMTKGGSLVKSYYLAAGASKTSTHNVVINSTQSIYYTVHASHGPDINKTRNTNSVTVTVENDDPAPPDNNDNNDDNNDYTPVDEIIIDNPIQPVQPINGVPKSGALFVAGFDNITYDGMRIERSCEVMTPHDGSVIMTGDIYYHLPDSIAASYMDRSEEDRCRIHATWRMGDSSSDAMDIITETYVLDSDDGVFNFSKEIVLNDVPILYDDIQDNLILSIDLIDPVDGNRFHDSMYIGLVYGPEINEDYSISLDELYFNGELVANTDEVIEVVYGTEFNITQNLSYTISEDELRVADMHRTRVEVLTHLDGSYPSLMHSPYCYEIPESASGDMVFEMNADRASYHPTCLDYGMHTLQITARQERDALPMMNINDTVVLTINVLPLEYYELADELSEDALRLFDDRFRLDAMRWFGLGNSVDMELEFEETSVFGTGNLTFFGNIDYNADEEFYVRVSYDDYMLEHYPESYTEWGRIRFENTEYIVESTTLEILTELIAVDDGEVLASDIDYLSINLEGIEARPEYRPRAWLWTESETVARGDDVIFNYCISNERSEGSLHLQVIDDEDGSIIYEDTEFELYEVIDSSFTRTPEYSELYSFTIRILGGDRTILWQTTFEYYIMTMPNHVEDGENGVFDLDLGAESLVIEEGERARVFCTVSYGVNDEHLAGGDVTISVYDQSGHVLRTQSLSRGGTVGFFEDYYIWDTTTFTITASAYDMSTATPYTDTDTITIEVVDDPDAIPEEDYLDIEYGLYTGARIISAGDSVEFQAILRNTSTETVTAAVIKDDGTFLGDVVERLLPGEALYAYEMMEFYNSDVLSFRAVAWTTGSTVVFTETKYRAVLVDEELAAGEDAAPEGEYAADLNVVLSTDEIIEGEICNVYVGAENTGTSPATIVVSYGAGHVFDAGAVTMPGDTASYTMRWSPATTGSMTFEARVFDEDGLLQYIASETVLLTVINPPAVPASMTDGIVEVDLNVTPGMTAVASGSSVDFGISVQNTGDVEFSQYVVSESSTGSSRVCGDLLVGETESFSVSHTFTRDTSIVFEVRAYADDGTLLAVDSQTVTVEMLPVLPSGSLPGDMRPVDDAGLPDDLPPAKEPMMNSALPAIDTTIDEVYTGGISMSLKPADEPIDSGRFMMVNTNEETVKANERVYMLRRIMAVLVGLAVVTLAAFIVTLIVRARRFRKS